MAEFILICRKAGGGYPDFWQHAVMIRQCFFMTDLFKRSSVFSLQTEKADTKKQAAKKISRPV